jgi:pilus assembly protein TadC
MNSETTIDAEVLILRIITLSLVMGVVIFGLIVVFVMGALDPANAAPAGPFTTMSYMGAAFAAVAFVLHLVIPNFIARETINKGNGSERSKLDAFRMKTIVALALLEGAAFMNLVAVMTEHQWWSLAVAGGLVFWMLARFPTRYMIENWLQPEQPPQQF